MFDLDTTLTFATALGTVGSAIFAAVSAIVAAVQLSKTREAEDQRLSRERQKDTIDAFSKLQEEVLDKLASDSNQNVKRIVENFNQPKCKEAYDDYRVLIARLEHFSVAVNSGIYDFDVLDRLGGEHIAFLYKKVKPVIDKANSFSHDKKYYCEFTELAEKLNEKHKNK